jgi:PAS domain S-box-containing protein
LGLRWFIHLFTNRILFGRDILISFTLSGSRSLTEELKNEVLVSQPSESFSTHNLLSYATAQMNIDPVLDGMTATLAQVFSVPICCVSLVDESYVWFKSRFGLNVGRIPASEDLPCVRTVRSGKVLAIPDLTMHPEFRDNVFYAGGFRLRFYAAAPLITASGDCIGTVCVMDLKPGSTFSRRDKVLLQSFAATVVGHLELRQQSTHLQDLAKAHRLLFDAVNQTDEAIIITDNRAEPPGPRIVYVNSAFSRMMGYRPEEIIGNLPRMLRGEETNPGVLQRALATNEPFEGETVKYRKDGSPVLVNGRVSPVRDSSGRITNYIGTYRDVTRERAAEKRTAEARDRAEAANKAKSTFLAAMSHEIRTPLNGVIGNVELLAGSSLDFRQNEIVTTIRKSGEMLLNVVNDILDFSKIEADKVQIETIDFSLVDILRDVMDLARDGADRKQLDLNLKIEATMPDRVVGDPQRLRQILLNVMSNAVKFTERGSVSVRASARLDGANRFQVTFAIQDTGIGVASDVQSQLFESFTQADSSMTRRYGGTGLGLAISRRLVHHMNGSISFSSEPQVGTTFVITVPFAVAAEEPGEDLRTLLSAGKVHVVSEASAWLPTVCEGLPFDSAEAFLNTLEAPRDSKHNFSADYVLLDASAANGEVHKFLDRISSRLRGLSKPAFLLLGEFSSKQSSHFKQAGFRHVFATPLRPEDLRLHFQANRQSGDDSASLLHGQDRARTRILVAEDNVINQKVTTRMLEKLNCDVTLACDGLEAVEAFRGADYDLILMDCQMPRLDGLEATRTIRQSGSAIPIVALTAHAILGDREQCLSAGMDDYLTKPVHLETLAKAVTKWSAEKKRRVQAADRCVASNLPVPATERCEEVSLVLTSQG